MKEFESFIFELITKVNKKNDLIIKRRPDPFSDPDEIVEFDWQLFIDDYVRYIKTGDSIDVHEFLNEKMPDYLCEKLKIMQGSTYADFNKEQTEYVKNMEEETINKSALHLTEPWAKDNSEIQSIDPEIPKNMSESEKKQREELRKKPIEELKKEVYEDALQALKKYLDGRGELSKAKISVGVLVSIVREKQSQNP